ncbi:hypothetical protein ACOMHN_061515 [Nucella lapillus]
MEDTGQSCSQEKSTMRPWKMQANPAVRRSENEAMEDNGQSCSQEKCKTRPWKTQANPAVRRSVKRGHGRQRPILQSGEV